MNNTDYKIYEFPECKSIIISGDIHAYSGGYPFSISGDIRSVPS